MSFYIFSKVYLSIHIDTLRSERKQFIKRVDDEINISSLWNIGDIPIIYLQAKNGDRDEDEEYLRYDIEIPENNLFSVWNSTDLFSVKEFENKLYNIPVPFNSRFGVYPNLKTFFKYIHLKLYYDKTIIYKNNEPNQIVYRLSGIENILIETDKLSKCIKCDCEIFGKHQLCGDDGGHRC